MLFARFVFGFVDAQAAAHDIAVMEGFDGGFGFGTVGHVDKSKALGTFVVAVFNDTDGLDGAVFGKGVAELLFAHVVTEVADVDFDAPAVAPAAG